MKKNFKIEHLDSLAQGVSKINAEIVFIPRTLPKEEGICEITGSKGRVSFAKLTSLEKQSDLRIQPECRHYEKCGGCDYLHTNYQTEIEFKENALKEIFIRSHRFESLPAITCLSATSRYKYRNRVQLHYDKKARKLGFKSTDNKISEIQDCLLPIDKISQEIKSLYNDSSWLKTVKSQRSKGHIELYLKDEKVQTTVNGHYSSGGFTQVNKEMNEKLQELLSDYFQETDSENIIDLFGGAGNITKHSKAEKVFVIDSTDSKYIKLQTPYQKYFQINLYDKDVITKLRELDIQKNQSLVLDPPRSGLKDIDSFTQELNPKSILYVSCNPQTLARDIKKIEDSYKLQKLYLIDFFPGTKHFETVAILNRK